MASIRSLLSARTPHFILVLNMNPFFRGILVGRSRSTSIASPTYNNYYYTSSPGMTCTWKIDTTDGYILQLTFDKMSITSNCYDTCCNGYVEVRDGGTSSDPLLGTLCSGNYLGKVSSKGNHMFVKYYGRHSHDSFQATVSSKKGTSKININS